MNLKPIHKIELNLLETLIMICRQYSLNYFLIGGSLLGSIRHQGFIPWDDDLDVGMPRNDYNQLLKLAPGFLSHTSYFLQTPFTDHDYGLSYAKLIDTDTSVEEINNINNAKKGIFIDIFPFDKIPDSSADRSSQMAKLKMLDGSIMVRLGYHIVDTPLSKLSRPLTVRQYNSVRQLKHRRDNVLQEYDDTNGYLVKNLASQYKYEKEIMTLDQMNNLETHMFENLSVNVPTDYDNILTQLYGDYLKLPSSNTRNPKHFKYVEINGLEII
ncbi:LicD family protein [Paucilactobacillus suebicus]|uniref:LPS biosynthesis protein n=1 Tax=Paucilactobacillus suebicus DSM 5007 = KCTC 3549 TaxID=1423807 RepID=A0A0R1W6T5_9LACO|nr:LicD family protein [Paucilactobacillus suebicus]KRM13550.1 LPS biosynthesis protein [Paucilactobacillus suebicus DSM 5007 = KCTC 3549]